MSKDASPGQFPFSRESAYANAPHESGVYVIRGVSACLYVGESQNLQIRLLEHLADTNGCVMRLMPQSFWFELAPADRRLTLQQELSLQFQPLCTHLMG